MKKYSKKKNQPVPNPKRSSHSLYFGIESFPVSRLSQRQISPTTAPSGGGGGGAGGGGGGAARP